MAVTDAHHAQAGSPSPTYQVLVGTRSDTIAVARLPVFGGLPGEQVVAAEDVTLRLLSPRGALVPTAIVQLTLDNREALRARQAFFGLDGPWAAATRRGLRVGLGDGRPLGVFCLGDVTAAAAGSLEAALERPSGGEGEVGVLRFNVRPGIRRTFGFALVSWDAASPFGCLEEAGRHTLARLGVQIAQSA